MHLSQMRALREFLIREKNWQQCVMMQGIEVTSCRDRQPVLRHLLYQDFQPAGLHLRHFFRRIKKERREILNELVNETRTIILYEAPHKLVRTLKDLYETLGNRRMTLCRELTKKHETAFRTTIADLIAHYENEKPLGECVLVIEAKAARSSKKRQLLPGKKYQ